MKIRKAIKCPVPAIYVGTGEKKEAKKRNENNQ